MKQMTKMLKIFLLILWFSSVCYSIYPKNRILDNSGHRDKRTTTTSSPRIIDNYNQPSTSGIQNSISVPKKKYETHVDENGMKNYVCTNCSHQTSSPSTASQHWFIKHDSRIFKCTECNYESFRKYDLKKHQQIIHQGLKPFKCRYCEYEASVKQQFIFHLNVHHRNVKEYKCTQCTYETARQGDFKRHIERIHPVTGPHAK